MYCLTRNLINQLFIGSNDTETEPRKESNSDIYKLNVTDPLKYKWSLLAGFRDKEVINSTTTFNNTYNNTAPIQTDVSSAGSGTSFKNLGLKARWIVLIIFVLIALICITIFVLYKLKQRRNKNGTYQQNISSNDELDKEGVTEKRNEVPDP